MEKTNFLELSFDQICGLSIDWSSDCNMACKYCYIEKNKQAMCNLNEKIQQALADGSFIANIKKIFSTEKVINQIEHISLWGAEPTINGQYFKDFIYEIFDYFPKVSQFMFSTNALMGGVWIYEKFVKYLYEYCEEHQRTIHFNLQFSLDGPHSFNDDSRHEGATQTTIDSILYLIDIMPDISEYLTLELSVKPTLDISYMKIMNEQGIECFQWYYGFFNDLQQEALNHCRESQTYITLELLGIPTLVNPGYHTQQCGKILAEWIHNLIYVDRRRIPLYDKDQLPLFVQLFSPIEQMLNQPEIAANPVAYGFDLFSCSAGKNNLTIDYEGNLFTCNRLGKNLALPEDKVKHAMRANTNINTSDKRWICKTWGSQAYHNNIIARRKLIDSLIITLAKAGQIDKKYWDDAQARTFLFYCIQGMGCHVGWEEDLTQNPFLTCTSVIKLIGNGAIEELIKYHSIGVARGELKPWKIARLI